MTFRNILHEIGWQHVRVTCHYTEIIKRYMRKAKPSARDLGDFPEIDFAKERAGVEVQFGKYVFMLYDLCAKMVIFHKLHYINAGVEFVPTEAMSQQMSMCIAFFK